MGYIAPDSGVYAHDIRAAWYPASLHSTNTLYMNVTPTNVYLATVVSGKHLGMSLRCVYP